MALFTRGRAELPESSQRWGEAMEAALVVNDIASSERPLNDAVQDMVSVAVDLLGAQQGSIMLLDDGGGSLLLVAASGLSDSVPLGFRLPVGESVAGRVLATGRPLLLSDVDADSFLNFVPKSRPISSSLVVPLRVQGRSIGVLSLATSGDATGFTEEDLRVAQLFADQTGGLIHRARLHERAERRSADLLALVESSKGLVGTLDPEAVLQRILDGGARLTGSKDGFACLFDPESGAVARGVFRGFEKALIRDLVTEPEVRAVVASSAVSALPGRGGLVATGLRTTRGTNGLLVLDLGEPPEPERIDLLRAFAQQCATALGAAELHSLIEHKESELASVIAGVPNPIVLVDSRNRIAAVNPAAEQLFGVAGAFSFGLPIGGALGHEEIEGMLESEGDLQSEVSLGIPPRTYRLRVKDVRVPGAPMGRVLIMDDLTAEREIAQTQRDFVAMIGHELRTPLTIIKGFAKTALKTVATASVEDRQEALATIDAKAIQLERLIEDLLYVSRIESREAALRVEDVHIATLVSSVGEEVLHGHGDREIEVEVPERLMWPCDETKVGLVLRHLLDNALKFSDPPQRVTVRATTEEDELCIDVVDEGPGLLSSDLPHIFERFRQVDSSSTRVRGGAGVGLYLCAQLVRVHGGRIWVDSTWGKGSTFSFSIPRRATTRKVVRMAARPAARAGGA
ncbi:MAG TPA: GAF domain-containing protein [Actinomycetota bacterium]|nr:GAF domain-containing protein [Actinomycetota bacterium]